MRIGRPVVGAVVVLVLGLSGPAAGGDERLEESLRACRRLLEGKKDDPPVAAAVRVEMGSFLQALGRARESFEMLDEAIATEGLAADQRRVIRKRALAYLQEDEWRWEFGPLGSTALPLRNRLLEPGEAREVEGTDLRGILTRAIGIEGAGVWVHGATDHRDLRRLALPREATFRRSLASALARLDPPLESLLLETTILVGPREAIARAMAVRDLPQERRGDRFWPGLATLESLGPAWQPGRGLVELAGRISEVLPLFVLPECEPALRSVKIPPPVLERLPLRDAVVVLAFLAPPPLELAWWRRSFYLGDPDFHRAVRERATVSSSAPLPAGPFDGSRSTRRESSPNRSLWSMLLALGFTWTGPPENLDIIVETVSFPDGPPEVKLEAAAPVWNLRYTLSGSGAEFEVLSPERQARLLQVATRTSGLGSAIASHLAWLARHQAPSGRWGLDSFSDWCRPVGSCEDSRPEDAVEGRGLVVSDVGVTALAILAFTESSHSHRLGEQFSFVDAVRKAQGFLKRVQVARPERDEHGRFRGRGAAHSLHDHALATMALAELLLHTSDTTALEASVRDAARFSLRVREPGGGWGFGHQHVPSDSYTTTWMILALRATKAALREADPLVPEIDRALEEALAWLRSVTDPETGVTGFRTAGDAGASASGGVPMLTAASLLVRRFCGEEREDPLIRKAVDLLAKNPPAWRGSEGPGSGTIDFSYAYFGIHAMFKEGGDAWKGWSRAIKDALIPNQRKGGCAAGSWDPDDPWIAPGGRVAATALATMVLEVDYRCTRAERGAAGDRGP
ncbi:MAG: hypothetical protein JXP34_28280 [Planctomycetes bacterium]|nr:hypothetical protein [Planctomycetota bacterium]